MLLLGECFRLLGDVLLTLLSSLLYFFVAASIGIPYIVSSYYFTQGMNAVRKLTDAITVSAQAWQPGEPFRFDRKLNLRESLSILTG